MDINQKHYSQAAWYCVCVCVKGEIHKLLNQIINHI